MLSVGSFHAVPVWSDDQDYDFGTRVQQFHIGCATEGGGFELTAGGLDHTLCQVAQGIEALVEGLG
jgi:hypothetical protein